MLQTGYFQRSLSLRINEILVRLTFFCNLAAPILQERLGMKNATSSAQCPKCGGAIPVEALQGVCPKCALVAAATPTESGQPAGERPPPPPLAAVAAAFPQLEILELIGAGGMGTVFKARQPKLDRLVALKLLSQPLAGDGAFAERFHREARLLARLNHPGIVSVYDYGGAGGLFYLLMEFVDGVNLRQAMRAGRFTPARALAIVPRICEALQFAHDEGILHRDIKPENILLDARGRVKIADFGIAKLIADRSKDAALTASGLAVGTPHYMAPEQFEHPQDVDQRADIFSLGVVFYEMLTGELPIGRFAPPSQKTPVDPRVDQVVFQALERERERRQNNAAEVKTRVEQITSNPIPQARDVARTAPERGGEALRTSLCYVTTPEYLKSFRGRWLYLYQGNGQLRLETNALRFLGGPLKAAIPLASLRAVTLGEYWLTAKPVPLFYLGITYLDAGGSRTLFFTPTHDARLPVRETNQVVEEWAAAVQAAIQAATGRAVTLNREKDVRRRFGPEVVQGFGMTVLLCSLLFPIFWEYRLPTRGTDFLVGSLIAACLVGSLVLVRWLIERRALGRGNLNDLTAQPLAYDKDDPILFGDRAANEIGPARQSAPPPATTPARISWKALASALCSIPSWIIVMSLLNGLYASLGADGLPPNGFSLGVFEALMLATGGFVGLAALSLGLEALREIRRSGGAMWGTRLAAVGILGIPIGILMKALPPISAALARAFGWHPAESEGQLLIASVVIGVLLLAALAAWKIRRSLEKRRT